MSDMAILRQLLCDSSSEGLFDPIAVSIFKNWRSAGTVISASSLDIH
jgi:hypothetical protein